jgi:hypothetical protein
MDNNVDLNVNNYNYSELLYLFDIQNDHNIKNNIEKMEKKLSLIKKKFNEKIYLFYLKVYLIINCIYLLEKKNVLDLENTVKISKYKNKIVDIHCFEKYDAQEIVEFITDAGTYPDKSISEIYDKSPLNNELNEPLYDVGKVNPSLNDRDNTNVIANTYPNKVAPGYLNSIKRIVQLQNLNLNSCFRDNYYSSFSTNFSYTIPVEIKNIISLRLASIEIPNSCYLFSKKKKNNFFKIEVKINNEIETHNIIIPDGNYDNETLTYYLNTTYFNESGINDNLKYIKFTIDNITFRTKFEIVDCDIPNYKISVYFVENVNQNIMNTFGWIIGFRIGSYLNIIDSIISEGLFDGSGDTYVYFSLNDYQYNNNISNIICFQDCINDNDILAKIPLTNGKLSLIINDNNNPLTKTRIYNGPVNINKFQIQILDKFGEVVDLNNMDFSFTLELELLYECFNFKDVFA